MTERIKGVIYDAGTVFVPHLATTRRHLDEPAMRRELEVIRDELHATHVRVTASDPDRLDMVGSAVLEAGLGLWYSPAVFGHRPSETARRLEGMAGHAQRLQARYGGEITFVAGSELTLFMRGLLPGLDITQRVAHLKADPSVLGDGQLARFLGELVPGLRRVFPGPLTYASLVFERPDWSCFDIVGVDHYRDDRNKAGYLEQIQPHLDTGRPVVVSEFGMRTYAGAASSGALGLGITDNTRAALHQLPLLGRFVRLRNRPGYVRDEAGQAHELDETLSVLEGSTVTGWFLSAFSQPGGTTDPDPRYDLDMGGMSLVKELRRGETSVRWPGRHFDAKAAFDVVARHYAQPPESEANIRIRAARPPDLALMVDIERAAGELFRSLGMDFVADDDPGTVEELASYASRDRALVAVDADERPVAYLLLDIVDGAAHIEQVSVLPSYAHRGIGRALIERAAAWAAGRGLRALTLTTYVDVPWNGPYYERLGFRYMAPNEETEGLRAIRQRERLSGLDRWPRACMIRGRASGDSDR